MYCFIHFPKLSCLTKLKRRERKEMELLSCRYKKTKAMKDVSTKQEERKTQGKGVGHKAKAHTFSFICFFFFCKILHNV